jgi:phosphoribosylformylglycinamidine synthase subunit PurQ / glutaminase
MNQPLVNALVLTGFGINCELETAQALRVAGAAPRRVHLNDLVNDPSLLETAQIFAIPGGFSFGDDVASGKILANRLRFKLGEPLKRFVEAGNLAIGICNGFQVMVKMGILPLFDGDLVQEVTVTHNNSSRFEDRWVNLRVNPESPCVWTKGIGTIELPIRHGEGKFLARDQEVVDRLHNMDQVALTYAQADGGPARGAYPANPNGSVDDIAGICDPSGRVFGLMPHPECHMYRENHPRWTREERPAEGAGLRVFRNAIDYVKAELLTT